MGYEHSVIWDYATFFSNRAGTILSLRSSLLHILLLEKDAAEDLFFLLRSFGSLDAM